MVNYPLGSQDRPSWRKCLVLYTAFWLLIVTGSNITARAQAAEEPRKHDFDAFLCVLESAVRAWEEGKATLLDSIANGDKDIPSVDALSERSQTLRWTSTCTQETAGDEISISETRSFSAETGEVIYNTILARPINEKANIDDLVTYSITGLRNLEIQLGCPKKNDERYSAKEFEYNLIVHAQIARFAPSVDNVENWAKSCGLSIEWEEL